MACARNPVLCRAPVDLRQHGFQLCRLALYCRVVAFPVDVQQRHPYAVERERLAHGLLVVGCAHADADIGIDAGVTMLPNPGHDHVYTAAMRDQDNAIRPQVSQVAERRFNPGGCLRHVFDIIVVAGVFIQHRHLQGQGAPAVCRQCLAQRARNLFPVGMRAAAVQYDGGSALRLGSGAGVYAGKFVTDGIEHEGFTL